MCKNVFKLPKKKNFKYRNMRFALIHLPVHKTSWDHKQDEFIGSIDKSVCVLLAIVADIPLISLIQLCGKVVSIFVKKSVGFRPCENNGEKKNGGISTVVGKQGKVVTVF